MKDQETYEKTVAILTAIIVVGKVYFIKAIKTGIKFGIMAYIAFLCGAALLVSIGWIEDSYAFWGLIPGPHWFR